MKSLDPDYKDVHELLGHNPLRVTVLKDGSFDKFKELKEHAVPQINPTQDELQFLLQVNKL